MRSCITECIGELMSKCTSVVLHQLFSGYFEFDFHGSSPQQSHAIDKVDLNKIQHF